MIERVQKIRFKGLDFILATPDDTDSAISIIDTYKKGECSYAHLFRKNSESQFAGKIMRFCQQIGTPDDIEFGEYIEIEIDEAKFATGLMGGTWPL